MKSLDDFFDYAASAETDFGRDLERVWLECNGELVDAASLDIVGMRASPLGVEMVRLSALQSTLRVPDVPLGERMRSVSGRSTGELKLAQ